MADYLLDTNVLSKFFYGDTKVRQFLDGIDAGINIIYIELIRGSIKKNDRERSKKACPNYPISRSLLKLPLRPLS